MLSVLWNGNSISTFACQETLPPGACSKPKGSRSVTRPVPFVCGRRWPHVARICSKHKGTWGQNITTTVDGRNPAPPGMYETL